MLLLSRCSRWPHFKITHQCALMFVAHLVNTDIVTKVAASTLSLALVQAPRTEEVLVYLQESR